MTTYTKSFLSESSDGKPIRIATSATPGTTLHATGTSTVNIDEVWIWANNTSDSASKVVFEFGGTEAAATMEINIAAEDGLTTISPGLPVNSGKIIRAYCSGTTNIVNIFGFVNRIT